MITRIEYQSKDGSKQAVVLRSHGRWACYRWIVGKPQTQDMCRSFPQADELARKWVGR
jgi:hypothetical protein